jgi:pimeloyl-ACP methyl ester carboxylesterase
MSCVLRALLALSLTVLLVQAAPAPAADGKLPRKGSLGVGLAPLSDEVRTRQQLAGRAGVLIESVIPDTTAAEGGIRPGDILLAVNGKSITTVEEAIATIAVMTAADKVQLTLVRDGQPRVLSMTLKERPRDRGDNFDVLYHHVVSRGARIRTIVTRPHAAGRHPVLFLIKGIGSGTIDEPLSGPAVYSRILNPFAKTGYVTVRLDKPGLDDSEGGPFADLDFDTERDAYRQAMMAVRDYAFVDVDNIFIFGHNMGGVFAPILASEIPVKGIAVYGTVAKTWTEYFLENWRRQASLAGDTPARIDSMLRDLAAALHLLLIEQKSPEEVLRVRFDWRSILAKLAPAGQINGRSVRFWSQVAAKNLPAYWAMGHANVMAIWGRHDFIATEGDHPFIVEIVNKA